MLHLTDIQADLLATVAEEAAAAGGRVALAEPADITDHDAVRRLAAQVDGDVGCHGRRPQRGRHRDLGHRARSRARALAVARRGEPDGPDPRHRGVRAADDRRRTRRPAGQRLVGGRHHRDAVARRLQRDQVRPARHLRGAALRPAPAPDRRDPGGSGWCRHRAGADHPDRRRRLERPQVPSGPEAVPVARGVAGEGGRGDLEGRTPQQVLGLHLGRHPARAPAAALLPARLRARDAGLQLGRAPGAAGRRRCPSIGPGSDRPASRGSSPAPGARPGRSSRPSRTSPAG